MSGLNPFRPKKPENTFAAPAPAPAPPLPPFQSQPQPSFTSHPSKPVPSVTFPSTSFRSVPRTPPASLTPDPDDTASSDDQSASDPFHQHSYATDDDGEVEDQEDIDDLDFKRTYQVAHPPSRDDDRSQPSIRTVPDPALYFRRSAPPGAITLPPQRSTHDRPADLDQAGTPRENAPVAASNVSTRSSTSYGGTRTPDSSSTDVSRPSDLRTGPATRAGSGLTPSLDPSSRPLASRPANRDRIPPPPPKSHHGKRIAPSPGVTPSLTQTTPGKATNRFSFHGSPSEPSYSPRPPQSGSDYFSAKPKDEPPSTEQSTESLRRSQSQHKRPPTPPLSRRHSQMRRSKTTMSKVNPLRLSIHVAQASSAASSSSSPPPSPSGWSLNPARTRESRTGSTPSEEPMHTATSTLRPEPSAAAPVSPTETSQSTSTGSSTKRTSLYNPLPPPPPPRRSRGSSNHSIDSSGQSLRSGKPADETTAAPAAPAAQDEFVPHPSNAHDILADLSRLQKEVDDLRGHYESRKASQ
ncbi:hypothetical protein CBS115989_8081 [Aspergillus niger]|uniref:Uncharacterized protein n=5 Tax=Aspergillus niger TaxID=5061 RepID=A0A370CBV4_ASPNG|nr:hypothetical protein CBS115989_8081 [Aspergillus niger]RDH23680.1 hypothetical protein M747DRAFT_321487 [Aspergillus niger ATCC 13496]KAI2839266.1 hypothetical protein CBS11232_9404 [Aspergillus niger]KAI2847593.1 hypothetical protein CBS11350_3119 [Aspergillus niger]KAI2848146.1 hypothetical protein CBS12448_9177 [Aspergillus niger]